MNFLDNLFIPAAHAQTFRAISNNIGSALEMVVPILFLVATIVFLTGVIMYITAGGKEDKIQKGKTYIIWGLIGLFVMVAVWGLVKIIINLVFGNDFLPSAPQLPNIPGSNSNGGTSGFPGTGSGGGFVCVQRDALGNCTQTINCTNNPDIACR